MIDGEKMIWAAVFAQTYQELHDNIPNTINVENADEWEQWEDSVVHQAVERATGAIHRLHRTNKSLIEGFGKESDVYKMYYEMVEI